MDKNRHQPPLISHVRGAKYHRRPVTKAGVSRTVQLHASAANKAFVPQPPATSHGYRTVYRTVKAWAFSLVATAYASLRRPLHAAVHSQWARPVMVHLSRRNQQIVGLGILVLVLIASSILPIYIGNNSGGNYSLDRAAGLLTQTPAELRKKLSYDTTSSSWVFNQTPKEQIPTDGTNSVSLGGPMYSAALPSRINDSTGVNITDTKSKLDIRLTPEFKLGSSRELDGHVVYPLSGTDSQLVYTFKQNGLKEDIILYKAPGDTAEFSYALSLPAGMEARLQDDGSVGIFGGDPTLFGDISYGSDADRAIVEKARQRSAKTHMYYAIPEPTIAGNGVQSVKAKFLLQDKRLTVSVSGLQGAHYPLSIDPSFVLDATACSWQKGGNNDVNISFSGCQLNRSTLSGGSVGTWNTTSPMPTDYYDTQTVVANGYMYIVGGQIDNVGGFFSGIQYAQINTSDGTVGAFHYTHNSLDDGTTYSGVGISTTHGNDRRVVAYNGYLYVVGGSNNQAITNTIDYAPLNANGTVGTFQVSASTMNSNRTGMGLQVYNGYLYAFGGCTAYSIGLVCNAYSNTAEYAAIKGNGDLGSWTLSGNTMTTTRFDMTSAMYNGYLYALGGCVSNTAGIDNCGGGILASVEYAAIDPDTGAVGTWAVTNSFTTARRLLSAVATNGYIYMMGGAASGGTIQSDVQLAKIYANGSLGPWQTTTSLAGVRKNIGITAYNGYIYTAGGCASAGTNCGGSGGQSEVRYGQISTALGTTSSYKTTNAYYDGSNPARMGFASIAYGGYIYILGGTIDNTGGTTGMRNTARYAAINSDGTLGTWGTSSTGFANQTSEAGKQCTVSGNCPGRINLVAGANNGYLYIAGGWSNASGGGGSVNWSDVQSATICTAVNVPVSGCTGAGDLRSWTTVSQNFVTNGTYATANGESSMAMQIYNGRMYLIGGENDSGSGVESAAIYSAAFTSSGSLGNFSASTVSLPSARSAVKTFVSSNNLYIVGGGLGGVWFDETNNVNDVQFIPIKSDGTLDGTVGWKDANAVINGGSGSSFSAANGMHGYRTEVSNGYLYVTGGVPTAAGTASTTVMAAKILSNGALGSWSTLSSLSSARYLHATFIVNGYLYAIGGCSSKSGIIGQSCSNTANMQQSSEYAQVYNGGGGAPTSWTQSTNHMITARLRHQAVVSNGYIYAISGCSTWATFPTVGCTALTGSVNYAKINVSTGDVGAWATTTAGVTAREYFAAVTYDGYIYVIGGCTATNCTTTTKSIQYAKPGATGNITSWTTNPTGLPTSWAGGAYVRAVSAGNNAYVFNTTSSAYTTIDPTTHQLNGDSGWTAGPSQITTYNDGTLEVVTNGKYIYELGGIKNGSGTSDIVTYVAINSNGSLGSSWNYTRFTDPGRHDNFVAAIYGGYLYIASGFNSLSTYDTTTDTQYAAINDDGSLGRWTAGPKLQAGRNCTSGVAYNGYLYTVGGLVGATEQDTFEWTALQTTPRSAQYSVLLATDKDTNPANIMVNSTQQSVASNISVGYTTATLAGATMSSLTRQNVVVSATKYPMTISGDGVAYYWLTITLDDNYSATYGESAGSNVSYLKLNYHPNPSMRLRGGKTFNTGIQQSLDAP